jgi:hypothetical protein
MFFMSPVQYIEFTEVDDPRNSDNHPLIHPPEQHVTEHICPYLDDHSG